MSIAPGASAIELDDHVLNDSSTGFTDILVVQALAEI